jgi:glycosyltransferase involved in cell wall biosynthesis
MEKTIEETIKSVLNQDYENTEYIIIDGNSSDGTISVINKYYEKIDVLVSEPDNGVGDAYNKALKYATGDVIYFLSADDYFMDSSVVSKVIKKFEEKNLDFAYGKVLEFDEKNNTKFINGHEMKISDLKRGECPHHQGFFAKRNLFLRYNNFDMNFKIIPDVDFMVKCFNDNNKYEFLDEIIAIYRWGIGLSSSHKTIVKREKEHKYILSKNFGIIDIDAEIETECVRELYKGWLEKILLRNEGITCSLKKKAVENVCIFGTRHTARYLLKDCLREGIQVVSFLDNNSSMQGEEVEGIKVYNPSWIQNNSDRIDMVIVSIESNNDIVAINQVNELLEDKNITKVKVISWKTL